MTNSCSALQLQAGFCTCFYITFYERSSKHSAMKDYGNLCIFKIGKNLSWY